jgi:hypothetical protein
MFEWTFVSLNKAVVEQLLQGTLTVRERQKSRKAPNEAELLAPPAPCSAGVAVMASRYFKVPRGPTP